MTYLFRNGKIQMNPSHRCVCDVLIHFVDLRTSLFLCLTARKRSLGQSVILLSIACVKTSTDHMQIVNRGQVPSDRVQNGGPAFDPCCPNRCTAGGMSPCTPPKIGSPCWDPRFSSLGLAYDHSDQVGWVGPGYTPLADQVHPRSRYTPCSSAC